MSYSPRQFSERSEDLATFVQDQLNAIANEFRNQQGAASLYTDAPSAALTITTVPVKLAQFTLATPQRDYRAVQPSVAEQALYVRRPGQVGCNFTITGDVPGASEYVLELYANGAATTLIASFDPSQQTAVGTFAAFGTFRVLQRLPQIQDKFELWMRCAAGSQTFTMRRGYFSIFWLGD